MQTALTSMLLSQLKINQELANHPTCVTPTTRTACGNRLQLPSEAACCRCYLQLGFPPLLTWCNSDKKIKEYSDPK